MKIGNRKDASTVYANNQMMEGKIYLNLQLFNIKIIFSYTGQKTEWHISWKFAPLATVHHLLK